MSSSLHFIFVNGPNLVGKDTHAERLAQRDPEATVVSTGTLFRNALPPTGKYHDRVAPYIADVNTGKLLPDEVIVDMAKEEIDELRAEGKRKFIFTGFPRTVDQLHKVDTWLAEYGDEVKTDHIALVATEQTVKSRLQGRREAAVQAGQEPRADDTDEILEKRLKVYKEQTTPMLHELAREGRLHPIASNQSDITEVFEKVTKAIEVPHTHRRLERR